MSNLNPYEVLIAAADIKGSTAKIAFFKENMSPELQFVLQQACSPYITFGVKQYEFSEPIDQKEFTYNWKPLTQLLKWLETRSLSGNNAQKAILETSKNLNAEQQFVLDKILQKDLRCGINEKTANKIIPGLIPVFSCQLANKDQSKIVFPCYAELKRNGKRVIAFVDVDEVVYYSRNGIVLHNLHIFDHELRQLAAGTARVFDGEVCGNTGDHIEDFKISKKIPKNDDPEYDASTLKFTVWDIIPKGNWVRGDFNTPLHTRYHVMQMAFYTFWEEAKPESVRVFFSRKKIIKDNKSLLAYFEKVLAKGNEGLVVKDPDAGYEFKRSNSWIKMKCGNDADLKIVDVVEGKKSWKGRLGAVVVKYGKYKVHCPLKGFTHAEAKKMWKDKDSLIGKTAKVEYMNESENDKGGKSLFLPKCVEIRDDK